MRAYAELVSQGEELCMRSYQRAWIGVLGTWALCGCVPGGSSGLTPSEGNLQSGHHGTGGSGGGPGGGGLGGGESGTLGGTGSGGGHDSGYVAPTSLLFCGDTGQIALMKNQRTLLHWAYPNGYVPPEALHLSLESSPADLADKGSVTPVDLMSARYQAPASVPVDATISVRAALGDSTTPAVCQVRLIKDTDLGIPDDGTTRGAVGNVYVLPVNQLMLPDFGQMTPVSQILVPNFDVPTRSFSTGFPGVEALFEWFGIRFEGRMVIPAAGLYRFRLNSDDGSILWIDGVKVIDNDGVHPPRIVDGQMEMTQGSHPFRLDYYQGPRYLIALELFWMPPSESAYVIMPPDNFQRPAP